MSVESHQEKLGFQAEVKQLLHIVVHSLYSNKEIFLRELTSNASDAIDKLRFEALSDPALLENDTQLNIHLTFDKEAKTITISDNGIGMSRDEVVNNLGTIAKSGTREFLSKLTGDQQKDAHLIGQFGVGFYSSFIVADKVTVLTRRAGMGPEHGVSWESTGDGEYTIANIEKASRGTTVILHLKNDQDEFLNDWRLRSIITKYADHLNIPIMMPKMVDEKPTEEWETINKATALWTLPKNEIKPEQYVEFYKHISHDFEGPLAYVHKKVEGNLEFTCILYVPEHAPFDLWQREGRHGLKLYVQRVFIMDHVEQLLPHYLRFIKGVLDTNVLPLNISREILQDHHTIPKLRAALVKHTLDLLDQMAANEVEKYSKFWKEFGNVLKEGPAEDYTNRERVAKLLRFSSTQFLDGQTVSFDEYIKRMKEKQTKIYYLTADNIQTAKSSPHLEVFYKNNIEVLLLTDKIDEWVVSHLSEYQGKTLQSVAKGDLSLEEISSDIILDKTEEDKKEKQQQAEFDTLINKMKTILTEQVKEVKLSHRLTNSPACLVRDQNAMGAQMERLLKAAGQAITEVKPILEVNPEHAIIRNMREQANNEDLLKEWTHLLFDQALLAEGGALQDPASFVQRVNQLWLQSFHS